jgi:predicted nucleic acid-binding Zn ribbon protein
LKKKTSLIAVGEVLETLKKTTQLGQQLEQAQIWERWEDLVGPELAPHARPKTIQDGTLQIEVDSTVWMNKIGYHRWKIIKRINRMARKELVSDIFLKLIPDDETVEDKSE